jgi:hypothetical protein
MTFFDLWLATLPTPLTGPLHRMNVPENTPFSTPSVTSFIWPAAPDNLPEKPSTASSFPFAGNEALIRVLPFEHSFLAIGQGAYAPSIHQLDGFLAEDDALGLLAVAVSGPGAPM